MQYAAIAGATVVAVDVVDDKLEQARSLGADNTVNSKYQDPVEEIQRPRGVDAAISLAVAPKTFEQAYRSLRNGGTVVSVALPAAIMYKSPFLKRDH